MANTGAPWNIPYVEPTDLVRDYPAADEAQALAVAAGLSAAGTVEQVVVSDFADNIVSTSSTSFVSIPNLSVSITPKSADNKIIAVMYVNGAATGDTRRSAFYRLTRDGTPIVQSEFSESHSSTTPIRLDEPSTTSSITYEGEFRSSRSDRGARARDRQILLIEVNNG